MRLFEVKTSTVLYEGVVWKTENCTNDATAQPLLTVNSVTVDLSNPNVRVIPAGS